MSDYDDTNKGVLFTQEEKESDRHPDLTGKVNVNGTEYRIAAWKRQSQNGLNYLSLSISEPRPAGVSAKQADTGFAAGF
jgi:uncharacterized protein (DUF736 family)